MMSRPIRRDRNGDDDNEKPPMLLGAPPEAAVVFSAFEFVFYAGVILTIAKLLNWL